MWRSLHLGQLFVFSKVHICGSVVTYFYDKTNLEIIPFLLHFSEVLKRMQIIIVLWGNVCNRLLHVNAVNVTLLEG